MRTRFSRGAIRAWWQEVGREAGVLVCTLAIIALVHLTIRGCR